MFKTLFFNLLSISVVTGITAAGVILLRNILAVREKRIASKWLCACWAILALRLLVPFNIPISAVNIDIPETEISSASVINEAQGTAQTAAVAEKAETVKELDISGAVIMVWLIGAAMSALWQIVRYFSERKRLLRWSRIADCEKLRQAERIAESLNVKKSFRLFVCEADTPPLLMGVFRPVLFLPSGLSGQKTEIALHHELTHLKRQDILFKTLIASARCAHWYNPLVHLMAREADRDAEAACDEAVLNGADKAACRDYCDTILDMMKGRRIPFATALAYKKEDIMKRFKNIFDTSKRKSGLALTVILLGISVVICGFAGCEVKNDNSEISNNISYTDRTLSGEISAASDYNRDAIITDIASDYADEGETADDGYMDIQTAMEIINEYRVKNGLHELIIGDVQLNETTLARLEEVKMQFSHTRPNGERWNTIFEEKQITYSYACENLARGQTTAKQVVEDWLSSEMHRKNLLDPNITYMHVACGMGKEGTEYEDYVYWIFLGYNN